MLAGRVLHSHLNWFRRRPTKRGSVIKFDRSLFILVLLCAGFNAPAQTYKTSSQQLCDGYPQVSVSTTPFTCLGLVADTNTRDSQSRESFRFPRKILELEPQRFLITDMGGWSPPNRGALWELDLRQKPAQLIRRLKGLYLPHDLEWGPDGDLYVGELGRIVRYSREKLLAGGALAGEVVVADLPTNLREPNLHPLVNFAFGATEADRWNLYVNIGAPNDACVKDAPHKCRREGEQGVIRHYQYQSGTNRWDSQFLVWASGLRNSMGLATHPQAGLLQVENSRDFRDGKEPYDELNWVQMGQHYGWPYCFNFSATSPEWKDKVDCSKGFAEPFVLLPPHSAPLDLLYYRGELFPELKNHLLISLHGYQETGSRIVALPLDETGLPVTQTGLDWTYASGESRLRANPKGGLVRSAVFLEVTTLWSKIEGLRPQGAPVGMTVAHDGSIYIVEDKNRTILRLSRREGTAPNPESDLLEKAKRAKAARIAHAQKLLQSRPELRRQYLEINQKILQTTCQGCHTQLKGSGLEGFSFMIGEQWIRPGQNTDAQLLIQRVKALNGLRRMPYGGQLSPEEIRSLESFVQSL